MPVPTAPDGLSERAATTYNLVKLEWNDNSDNEDNFILERNDGSGWSVLDGAIAKDKTTFDDSPVTPGKTYEYRISAKNDGGTSDPSTVLTVEVPNLPALTTPTNLRGRVTETTSLISLEWDDVATEDNYVLEKDKGSGWFTLDGAIPEN